MSRNENLRLLDEVKNGDKFSEAELVRLNLGLVHSVLRHFRVPACEYEDLFQIGCIGLLKAARGFDSSKSGAFSTYAVCVVSGEIKRCIRDCTPVKMSRRLREIHLRVIRATQSLTFSLGREPTVSELSEETGDTVEEIVMSEEANRAVLSLDYSADGDGGCLADTVGEDTSDKIDEKLALALAMEKLGSFDRKMIVLRYFKNKTQCETAKMLGVTQVRISRRERAVLSELRRMLIS